MNKYDNIQQVSLDVTILKIIIREGEEIVE